MIFDREILICKIFRTFCLSMSAACFISAAQAQEFDPFESEQPPELKTGAPAGTSKPSPTSEKQVPKPKPKAKSKSKTPEPALELSPDEIDQSETFELKKSVKPAEVRIKEPASGESEKDPSAKKSAIEIKPKKTKRESKKVTKKDSKPKADSAPPAETPAPPPPSPPPQTGELKLDVGLESYSGVSYLKPSFDIASYSDNQTLLPFIDLQLRLRPSVKLISGRAFTLHTRPYFEMSHQQAYNADKSRKTTTGFSADFGESILSLNVSNRFSLTAGQENFQWGAAELNGPSNWIYRSTELAESISRNPQSRVKTRRTFRVNFSNGQSFNLVSIVEFEAEKRIFKSIFEGRRFLVKPEYSWNSGADYLGLVLGGAERQKFPFFGEYTSANLGEAMSVYADAAHYQGSDLLRPESVSVGAGASQQRVTVFTQPDVDADKWTHEVLFGVKYAFANGTDLRFEGYSNSAGYTFAETKLAEKLYSSGSQLFPLFFFPAGETRAPRSLFVSLRRNNFGKNKNWTVLARYWKPVSDSSGGAVLYADYGATDNATIYMAAGGFHGPLVSESALAHRFAVTLGQKYVW
ncbi:MAG: hypothetical protein EBR09_06735 [Proteobacteria bacterium]|nr:hypothetical protein [Pseudomonadota bacterium]